MRFDTTSIAGGSKWRWTRLGRHAIGAGRSTSDGELSLIGRIGEVALPEGAPERGLGFVGSSSSELTALSGRLYLGFNDDYYVDNSRFSQSLSSNDFGSGRR